MKVVFDLGSGLSKQIECVTLQSVRFLLTLNKHYNLVSIDGKEAHQCCLCQEVFIGVGNNPEPCCSNEAGRCCNKCNAERVRPARMYEVYN